MSELKGCTTMGERGKEKKTASMLCLYPRGLWGGEEKKKKKESGEFC